MSAYWNFDVIVIGAGLIGLACAEELAKMKYSVLVVERHAGPGREASSRNSGVLHAGIYHPPDSLKTRLCLRGRTLLEARSRHGRFALKRTGKLVVASNSGELPRLEALAKNAAASGVVLEALDSRQVARLEPNVRASAALWSPHSGIIDVEGLVASYRRGAEDHGATCLFQTRVTAIEPERAALCVALVERDGSLSRARSRWVVNAAGLEADDVARLAGVDVVGLGLTHYPCKGSYFTLSGRLARCATHLIYPLPSAAGLGIHLTPDLTGHLRAGPDAEYVTSRELNVDESKREAFAEAVRRYMPGVRATDLAPGYAGLRPKLAGPGQPARDFVIRDETAFGLTGLINLLGIESPGLTASPAIGEWVAAIVSGRPVSA